MDEFIAMATEKLGVGESEGKSATAGVLEMIKGQLDPSTFQSVLDQLPGASSLLGDSESNDSKSGGGGLLGSITSMAGGLLGGSGSKGGMMGLAASLAGSGMGMDKIGDFVSMMMEFMKDKLNADTFQSVLSAFPGTGKDEDDD